MSSITVTNQQNQLEQASGLSEQKLRSPQQELGQADFLQLLTVQLQHQDPMNPQTDMDFIASMSSFSSVEAIGDLSTNFEKFMTDNTSLNSTLVDTLNQLSGSMVGNEQTQNLLAAQSYLGKEITIFDKLKGEFSGVVDRVELIEKKHLDGTNEQIVGLVVNEEIFTLDQVTSVQNPGGGILSTMGNAVSSAAQAAVGML